MNPLTKKIHLVRHDGVFAPANILRREIVPNPSARMVWRSRCVALTPEQQHERKKGGERLMGSDAQKSFWN